MALTAAELIALALESAHSQGKAVQGQLLFNSILSDLCQTYDFAEARGQYLFAFQPGVQPPIAWPSQPVPPPEPPPPGAGAQPSSSSNWNQMRWNQDVWGPRGPQPPPPLGPDDTSDIWNEMAWNVGRWGPLPNVGGSLPFYPGNQFGSGPYVMPLDFLRLSGSSGSSGSQRSFIWWLNGVPYPVIPMDLAEFDLQVQQAGLQSFVWLSATDMSVPLGDRILLTTTGDIDVGSTVIKNLGSTNRLVTGGALGVAGQGIVPGTMLLDFTVGGKLAKISIPANESISGASIFFGHSPLVFIYPPPQSSLQAMIRYQKQMPPMVDFTRHAWFRNDGYILEKLIGRLCQLNDDARADALLAGPDVPTSPDGKLRLFLAMKDDEQSHPKRVELDRRAFGRGWASSQRVTKFVGW